MHRNLKLSTISVAITSMKVSSLISSFLFLKSTSSMLVLLMLCTRLLIWHQSIWFSVTFLYRLIATCFFQPNFQTAFYTISMFPNQLTSVGMKWFKFYSLNGRSKNIEWQCHPPRCAAQGNENLEDSIPPQPGNKNLGWMYGHDFSRGSNMPMILILNLKQCQITLKHGIMWPQQNCTPTHL